MRSGTSGKVLSRLGLANTAVDAGASTGGAATAGEVLNAGGEGGALSPH